MKKMNKELLNLPASGRRKGFKSSDPADGLCNILRKDSQRAFLTSSLSGNSSKTSLLLSLYVNFKSSPKLIHPTFSVNFIILTVTSRGIWLTVTIKTKNNYQWFISLQRIRRKNKIKSIHNHDLKRGEELKKCIWNMYPALHNFLW